MSWQNGITGMLRVKPYFSHGMLSVLLELIFKCNNCLVLETCCDNYFITVLIPNELNFSPGSKNFYRNIQWMDTCGIIKKMKCGY